MSTRDYKKYVKLLCQLPSLNHVGLHTALQKVGHIHGIHAQIALPIAQGGNGHIVHAEPPQVVQGDAQGQAQLQTDDATMGHDGDVFIMTLLCKNMLKGQAATLLGSGKGFAVGRLPLPGTVQKGFHFLGPAGGYFRIFQSLPIAKADFLEQIQGAIGHAPALGQHCRGHPGPQHGAGINSIDFFISHIGRHLAGLGKARRVQGQVHLPLEFVAQIAVRLAVAY